MKTEIKKFGIPFGVIAFAVAGAFASNLPQKNDASLVDRNGYRLVGEICSPTTITCSTIFNLVMCKDVSNNQLYDWNGTSCPDPLYHKP